MDKCQGVLVPDGTRHCFVEERGMGKRTEFRAFKKDPLSPSVDHFIPRSMGGDDDPENLHIVHWYDQLVQGGLIQGPILGKQTQVNRSSEERSKHGRMANQFSQAARTTEQRRKAFAIWQERMSKKGVAAHQKRWNSLSPEEKQTIASARTSKAWAGMTPEERSIRAKRACHTRYHTGPDARPCNCKHLLEEE